MDLSLRYNNLVEMISVQADRHSIKTAITFIDDKGVSEESLSYADLASASTAISIQLLDAQLAKKTAILLYPPGLDYVKTFFGCLFSGVRAVPAYPPMGAKDVDRLAKVISDCGATAILCPSTILSPIKGWMKGTKLNTQIQFIATDLESNLNIDYRTTNEFSVNTPQSDDIAFLQYTSGSTGNPKGVMVSHRNLLHNLDQIASCYFGTDNSLESYDQQKMEQLRSVSWLPPFHDMGLINGVLTPLYLGGEVTLMSPASFIKNPYLWLRTVSDTRAQFSGGPNFSFAYCVRKISEEQKQTLDLSHWEVAFNGAEPIQYQTIREFSDAFASCGFKESNFSLCYGLAEATLIVTGSNRAHKPRVKQVPASALSEGKLNKPNQNRDSIVPLMGSGFAVKNLDLAIVAPDTRLRCEDNEVGEIWINSPAICSGYWNKPRLSEEVFRATIADSNDSNSGHHTTYLRTGDLGFLDNGELHVTGRMKDVIIIRGKNIYPQDIEVTVQEVSTSLKQGCGAAFSFRVDGEEKLTIVQEFTDKNANNETKHAICMNIEKQISIKHQIKPYRIVLISPHTLPKTSSGKIQRNAAKNSFNNESLDTLYCWSSPDFFGHYNSDQSLTKQSALKKSEQAINQPSININVDLDDTLIFVRAEIAKRVGSNIDEDEIDLDVPFAELGLDSIEAIEVIAAIQEKLGRIISAIELMRHPTVLSLTRNLSNEWKGVVPQTEPQQLDDLSEASLVELLREEVSHHSETELE